MDKKIKNFLRASFIGVIIVCIIIFVWLTVFMAKKTEDTVENVSKIYMSEANVQLQQKFSSIISLRLNQVEGIIKSTSSDKLSFDDELLKELIESAEIREFSYLGFYTEDGGLEIIYGEDVEMADCEDAMKTLKNDGTIVEHGITKDGEKVLLLGKPAGYPMRDGGTSLALVAGVSMEYLDGALFLDTEQGRLYSHIIDSKGNFIIRNADAYRDSYFERIRSKCKENKEKSAEEYVEELSSAMAKGDVYYTSIFLDGEKRQMYCSPIFSKPTWYLISAMPNEDLDNEIGGLDKVRVGIMLGAMLVILLLMSLIFIQYFRLSQQQMQELEKTKQEALRANMAKSEFLSSMSHDIRTPMNAIIGMTEIALKNLKDPERTEDCLRKVKLSSKHLLGLINDVLDMSKIESGKMTLNMSQMSLRDTMDDIVNIMQPQVKANKQYFDIFIQKIESEEVCCDSVRLNQVLLNILSNAVKFTPEGGRIDVHLYQEESPLGDNYVRTHFRIKDTGIGMSEEFQKKIFDSFVREETEQVQNIMGTGLGMSITKCIVDLMHGTIELQSEQGKGSEFHVILDLEKAQEKETEMVLPPWNVLVVDDNEQLCLSAAANLEELGVHADWSMDGSKAVEMIEERHKKQDDYHFVLLDWKMPHMDGIQTLREIRKRVGKKIPVFLISAYDWSDIEEEAQAEEIEGFVSKPLFKSTLFACLKRYVEGNKKEIEKKEKKVIDFSGKRVLVSEDVDINWEIANEVLSSVGLQVDRAVNGKVCVEQFEQSEPGFYDAILMDIRMPVMDGYDATKAIRALNHPDKDLPIIAMTADAFSGDVQVCLDCGMNDHIAKPIDMKELMRILQKYLQ